MFLLLQWMPRVARGWDHGAYMKLNKPGPYGAHGIFDPILTKEVTRLYLYVNENSGCKKNNLVEII